MANPFVLIILVNHNTQEHTLRCLSALSRLDYDNHQVVIIDNGTTPLHAPGSNLLRVPNRGYAAANNVALRTYLADYYWLLNPDTEVAPDALKVLVDLIASDPEVGAVGSRVETDRGLEYLGGFGLELHNGVSWPCLKSSDRLDFLSGCSLLFSRAVLETVGLLDERYFLYWEDADYCLRIRQAGFRLAVCPTSLVRHTGSASTGQRSPRRAYFLQRYNVVFLRRHSSHPLFASTRMLWRAMVESLGGGHWREALGLLAGYLVGWLAASRSPSVPSSQGTGRAVEVVGDRSPPGHITE